MISGAKVLHCYQHDGPTGGPFHAAAAYLSWAGAGAWRLPRRPPRCLTARGRLPNSPQQAHARDHPTARWIPTLAQEVLKMHGVPEESVMDCCRELSYGGYESLSRRRFLAWLVALSLSGWAGLARAQGRRRVRLGFCGQLLCVVPYEVARHHG